MSEATGETASGQDVSGTWRKGEFVRWQDLFSIVQAALTWFGASMLVLSIVFALHDKFGISKTDITHFVSNLPRNAAASQIATASFEIVLLFYAWRVASRVADASMVARYRAIARGAFLPALLGGAALALASIFLNAQLAAHSLVQFHVTEAERLLVPQSAANLPIALVCVALIAPFAEELYFRGVVLSWLRRKMAAPLAVPASAAVFALLHFRFLTHMGPDGWVYTGTIAVVGVATATVALTTRSLWSSFAIHAGYNATLIGTAILAPLLAR
ncbi:MAG TPA: CPBP family intramembrane glutamic endopeptidase [Rhizomicrobium sp.]|nr:CPBP family intramembrane glutamic endopeptidase [Rhizomicrobium sp.]